MAIQVYSEFIKYFTDAVAISDDASATHYAKTDDYNFSVTIGGSTVSNLENCQVIKRLGDVNSSSKFTLTINNYNGDYSTTYNVGDEVVVYYDTFSPPMARIFTGILENIELKGKEQNERLVLSGKDYSTRLIDTTVEPEVYNNLPAGSIVNDIITKYTDNITTANVSSGLDVNRIVFNHTPVFDAIKQLAETSNYMFYVDDSKDLHFKEKSANSSGYTFGSGGDAITKSSFKERRDGIYNEVWVYGDRYLDRYQETFTGDTGSTYTLGYNPHNTSVTNSGTVPEVIQPGGVYQMTYDTGSQYKYLVNYSDKQIILTSGTLAGDNRYVGSDLIIDYMRDLPIVKFGNNDSSIDAYGKRVKIIQDTNIKDPLTAATTMLTELENSSDPLKEGTLSLYKINNINVGDTCVVNIPQYGINSVKYDIIEVKYDMTKKNLLSDNIISIKVNRKVADITDTLKDIILQQKKLQGEDIQSTDLLTRYKVSVGSIGIRTSGLEVWTQPIGSSFILGHLSHGLLGSYASHNLGDHRLGSIIQWSGGYW